MHTYAFEKLHVWIAAKDLAKDLYIIPQSFPKEEMYDLTSQIRRASVSIASNIAERAGKKDNQYA